jgi:glucose/arabinose dehydrogenase
MRAWRLKISFQWLRPIIDWHTMVSIVLSYRARMLVQSTSVKFLAALAVVSSLLATPSEAVNLKAELVTATGLSFPAFGTAPAGQSGVLYISEQNNVAIKILNLATKQFNSQAFLDLPNISGGQAGLSAIAFHPDYANNGKFYLNVFDSVDDRVKILEYQRSAGNPLVADVNSRREILSFDNISNSHNGGWLGFSPVDGYLYIATGDGGLIPGPDYGKPAQDLSSPKGKILRINVNVDDYPLDTTRNYGIPATNPFEFEGATTEAYAIGLRHPYRASFDRANGDLYIADVGSNLYEEVNVAPGDSGGGENFGWRALEGPFDNPNNNDPAPPGAIDPVYYYDRGVAAAIIGGYVYRGSSIPGFEGHYIFADAVTDAFGSLRYDGTTAHDIVDRTSQLASPWSPNGYGQITSFGEDANGELYFFDRTGGDVYKIVAGEPDPIAGDFDEDGDVDGDDLVIWQQAYGSDDLGDADDDGDSDGRDLLIWQRNMTPEAILALSDVPEPTSGILLLLATTVTCGRMQRARKR